MTWRSGQTSKTFLISNSNNCVSLRTACGGFRFQIKELLFMDYVALLGSPPSKAEVKAEVKSCKWRHLCVEVFTRSHLMKKKNFHL